jgi:hypothetical protein
MVFTIEPPCNFGYEAVFLILSDMRHCPKCKSQYPDDMTFCLIDGDSLLVNDPEAETLRGQIFRPSKTLPIPIKGEAIQQNIWLSQNKPYSLVHPDLTIILLYKDIVEKGTFGLEDKGAYVAFYGNRKFHHGQKVRQVAHNEYFMPAWDEHFEEDISVFYFMFSNGHSNLFRGYVGQIDEKKKRIRMDIGLLLTTPENEG